VAYFYKGALWQRVLVFLSSVPITIFMNSVRIGVIGVMVEYWGIAMAEGFLHEFQGWMVFMVSMLLMIGEVALLNRFGRGNGSWREVFGVELPAPSPKGVPIRSRSVPAPLVAGTVLLVGLIAMSTLIPRPQEIVPSRASFARYPMSLGEWRGRRGSLETVYTDQLQLDDYVLADYTAPDNTIVNLYISWYNSQRKGEAVHSPRACLPAGGWEMREFDQRDIPNVRIDGQPLRVNRVLIELGNQRQLVYYWFQQRGRIITNEFAVKWYLFWDSLTRHRSDGAMVRLVTPVPASNSAADADTHLADVLRQISPDLTHYVPD
jgi:exosortase D (VPLPA-CTERM-specific)